MSEKKVFTYNQHKQKLVGLRAEPDQLKTKNPAVILVHGFGVTKEEDGIFNDLARLLTKVGFLVYRFDFTGRGESEGDYSRITLTDLDDDLSCIIEFVRQEPTVNQNRIGIAAQSLGTATVIALAPKIQALVLMGAFHDVYTIISNLYKRNDGFNPKGVSTRLKPEGEIITMGSQFWSDLENNHAHLIDNMKKFTAPTLFIWGTKDDKVPETQVKQLYDQASGLKVFTRIEGADHGYEPKRNELYPIVIEWLKHYL